jgi:hypothetical protein
MGIAYGQRPGIDRKWVGEAVGGDVALDIDEANGPPSSVYWRIAAILTVAAFVRRGDDTNDPVARSKAKKASLHQAGGVVGPAWS